MPSPLFVGTEIALGPNQHMAAFDAVLGRHEAQRAAADPRLKYWELHLAALRGQPPAAQLAAVNAMLNRIPFRAEAVGPAGADRWLTPAEFLYAGGACRDFAVAKYLALKSLGWRDADLRVAIVADTASRATHAILVASLAGRALVLDNRDDAIVEVSRLSFYVPAFSMNARSLWVHKAV